MVYIFIYCYINTFLIENLFSDSCETRISKNQ
uniref:Uncharacterized protein n=1 Tax=Heterorhabditis bacteriophora TaxID=37862 RepID=A0A1I7W874_HETBA